MTPNKIRAPNKVKLVAVLDVLKYKNLASASCTSESKSSAKAVAQRPRKKRARPLSRGHIWGGLET